MIQELTCFLYNKKLADLDVKVPDIEARISIDLREIESVRERGKDDSDDLDKKTCIVNMKSGDSYQIKQPYATMMSIWKQRFK